MVRHRDAEHAQRPIAQGPELEACTARNREADAGLQDDDFFAPVLAPPHLAAALHDVPDLLDRPMPHGGRDQAGGELELGHAAAG
jgi:hypothetical protein